MATNRYYKPSAPRYTSQFVEDRYPEDLILQSGAMKYAQKQKFAEDVGQLSALNNMLQPGYRTQEVAYGNEENPGTIEKWNETINQFINKYQTNYDSPQALMELSQLRYSWMGDKDVQLIQQDREVGNKQYDDIKRATKTYSMDYDPNINPQQGSIKQFRSGEPYRAYDPLINFEDTDQYAFDMFNKVRGDVREVQTRGLQANPFTGQPEEVLRKQQVEYRDMNKLQPVVETLVQGVLNNTMPGAAYLKTKFRDEYGNPREPKADELRAYFTEQAKKAQYSEIRGTESYSDLSGAIPQSESDMPVWNLPLSDMPDYAKDISKKDIVKNRISNFFRRTFGKEEVDYKQTDDYLANAAQGIANRDKSFYNKPIKDQLKVLSTEADNIYKDKKKLSVSTPDAKLQDEQTQQLFGNTVRNHEVMSDAAGSILQGQTLYDYDTMMPIQETKVKAGLLKKGNQVRLIGPVAENDKYRAPEPGMMVMEVANGNDVKTYLISNPNIAEKERLDWNMNSYKVDPLSGIGNVFSVIPSQNGQLIIDDKTNVMYDYNDANVGVGGDEHYRLHFIPVKDNFDGEIKLKVYRQNPLEGKEGQSALLFDNEKNNDFIKEYNYKDFNFDNYKLMNQVVKDYEDLIARKYNK